MGIIIKTNEAMKIICGLTLMEKLTALGWFECDERKGYRPTEKGYDKLSAICKNPRTAQVLDNVGIYPAEIPFDILAIKTIMAKLVVLGWANDLSTFSFTGINRLLRLTPRLPIKSQRRIAKHLHNSGIPEKFIKQINKRRNH